MDVFYSFDLPGEVLTIHYTGEPSIEEWTETMEAAMADPRFRPGIRMLLDRHLVGTPSPEFVRGVADFVGTHRATLAQIRCAIVVGGPGSYGMARMGQALLEFHGVKFEIFDSLETAEAWLRDGG